MEPKRILIARTDRLGDVILSTSVIRFFREKYPDAYIAFMVRPENKDVVLNNPHLDEIITYDKYGLNKSLWSTIKIALLLKTKKFDTAVALHPTNRVHLMLFVAGISVRIGYNKKMGCLLTHKIFHDKHKGDMHEAVYNFNLLEKAGFDISGADFRPYMITTKEDGLLIDSVQKDHNISSDFIAVHVGASCMSKRWSPENFARVADELSRRYNHEIVLVGGDETSEFSRAVVSKMKRKVSDLTGTLLLGELAELLSRSKLFISNDSGPVHVSVAMGTPVVVIFGRNDPGLSPKRWGPLGEKDIVLHKPLNCSPCLAHECDNQFQCLQAITVDDVVQAAAKILN